MLTVVMYHYIRDLPHTRFPAIKGMLVAHFDGQLDYLTKHYAICDVREVVAAIRGDTKLPKNACLLTFDDGFLEHFTVVLPRLDQRRLPAVFFVPVCPIERREMLDVHLIYFVLAATSDPRGLAQEVCGLLGDYRSRYDFPDERTLYQRYAKAAQFDVAEVAFIKRVLQNGLPQPVRSAIARLLFLRHVAVDATAFASELYMDAEQVRGLVGHGMMVGGHGYDHPWLETLPARRKTIEFLRTIGPVRPGEWVMSYPYGSHNATTLDLLGQAGCALAVMTQVGLAEDLSAALEIPRLDAVDLPTARDAPESPWTARVRSAPAGPK